MTILAHREVLLARECRQVGEGGAQRLHYLPEVRALAPADNVSLQLQAASV